MQTSNITWTEKTWNPVTGCTPISEGCRNCYAKRMAETRLRGRCGYDADEPFKVTYHPQRLDEPDRLRKPSVIFVCSMGDLFHMDVQGDWLRAVCSAMLAAKRHRFIVLTKRPKRMYHYLQYSVIPDHIYFGTSVEDQQTVHERIPWLLKTPAKHRFVSIEPMLGQVNIARWLPDIDQVILGGESGPGARPMHPDWVRSVRDQCEETDTPFHFKQWGRYVLPSQMPGDTYRDIEEVGAGIGANCYWGVGKKRAGRTLDGRTHNDLIWR